MIVRQSASVCFLQALKLVVQYFSVYLNSVSDGSIWDSVCVCVQARMCVCATHPCEQVIYGLFLIRR